MAHTNINKISVYASQ